MGRSFNWAGSRLSSVKYFFLCSLFREYQVGENGGVATVVGNQLGLEEERARSDLYLFDATILNWMHESKVVMIVRI